MRSIRCGAFACVAFAIYCSSSPMLASAQSPHLHGGHSCAGGSCNHGDDSVGLELIPYGNQQAGYRTQGAPEYDRDLRRGNFSSNRRPFDPRDLYQADSRQSSRYQRSPNREGPYRAAYRDQYQDDFESRQRSDYRNGQEHGGQDYADQERGVNPAGPRSYGPGHQHHAGCRRGCGNGSRPDAYSPRDTDRDQRGNSAYLNGPNRNGFQSEADQAPRFNFPPPQPRS